MFIGSLLITDEIMNLISKLLPVLRHNKPFEFLLVVLGAPKCKLIRYYSTGKEKGLTQSRERGDVSTDVRPLGEKIKETTKTVSDTGIILVGVGITGIIFYYVLRELFSSNSPNSIYLTSIEKCKNVSNFGYFMIY